MSSGDKGVQGLQYLNYFSYSLKFLLLNISLFYLKQDKRAFTTQIFPALVFSNEGGFYMSGNREYKSDVFSMLMQDKERALQLYNAMNGSSYDNPEDVEIVIHDGGISLSVRNDASFIVDARLSIYEHQSTVCPNMPVRSLIYFSVILSDMLSDKKKGTKKGKNIYGRRLVKIPTPHFVVFYNGEEEQPEVQELKLSDAFEKPTDEPNLELKCKVYNINDGKNKAIMESCGWLNDYMTFVNKVREYHADGAFDDLAIDIEKAIDYCIDNDILKEFLKTYRSEVTKSMQLNYEFDRQLELERADAIEEGLEQGIKQGLEQGLEQGIEQGLEQGIEQGLEQGIEQGLEQGIELINQLNQILLSEGKYDELQKASKDKEYQKKLLAEYGLLNEKQGE